MTIGKFTFVNKHKNKLEVLFVALTVFVLGFLRFNNLGYSQFIPDETTVMSAVKHGESLLDPEFLFAQNKGPLQFIVAELVSLLGFSVYDEFSYRVPFALLNIGSLVILYFLIKKLTGSVLGATFGVFLFGVNGFTVAFGRLVQYQSLNIFFSILSLYFIYTYTQTNKSRYFLLSTTAFILSMLAHWDAVIFAPILLYLGLKPKIKKDILVNGLILGFFCLVFVLPFYSYVKNNISSDKYLSDRLGYVSSSQEDHIDYYRNFVELYNPFFFVEIFVVFSFFGILSIKSHKEYFVWYVIVLFLFLYFVRRSGTHIYNVLLPFSIISGIGVATLTSFLPKLTKPIIITLGFPFFVFLWWQSFSIFADVNIEYPWQQEVFSNTLKTPAYGSEDLTNNVIGFPINRRYKEMRVYLEDTFGNGYSEYTYQTNGSTSTASYYIELDPSLSDKTFVLGIKRPSTFVTDYKFSNIKPKSTIAKFKNESGETVSRIYLYEKRD